MGIFRCFLVVSIGFCGEKPVACEDWGHFKNLETDKMNPFSGTGGSMSISSNRLAYVFGFRGPSGLEANKEAPLRLVGCFVLFG